MRIFVSEYLSTGVLAPLPASLAREGLAMLLAVLGDLAACPGVEVVTMVAPSLRERIEHEIPSVRAQTVVVADEEHSFRTVASECDAALVIAPEFDDLLATRVDWVADAGCRHLGSSSLSIRIAGDKVWLPRFWRKQQLPTPETHTTTDAPCPFPFPAVVKPRRGAGAQDTYRVRNEEEYRQVVAPGRIVQPYIPGQAASVSFLVGPHGPLALPAATQDIRQDEGRFSYHGGRMPLHCPDAVVELARRAVEAVPGLQGYVGVDFVLSDPPMLLEINPRLTTSYVGLRRLIRGNLMQMLLDQLGDGPVPRLDLNPGSIGFQPDGSCEEVR